MIFFFFFSSRRRHTRCGRDWSSDVCSSDLSDVLRRRVKAIHRGNGDEAIELVDDRRVKFKARTQGGGRGLTADKDVLDESMFLLPAHMGALLPTLSARPDPQVLYGGSAGLAKSDVWRAVRDRGRIGSA